MDIRGVQKLDNVSIFVVPARAEEICQSDQQFTSYSFVTVHITNVFNFWFNWKNTIKKKDIQTRMLIKNKKSKSKKVILNQNIEYLENY